MSAVNKVLVLLMAVLGVVAVFEVAYYFGATSSLADSKTQASSSSSSTRSASSSGSLTDDQIKLCSQNSNIIREFTGIERDLGEKTLDSVTMSYSYAVKIVKIEAPCTRNYGGYPLNPDLCLVADPKAASQAKGKTKQEFVYKFIDTPVINVLAKKNGSLAKIALTDIKPGDTVEVTSVHNLGKPSKTPFFNYDNVTALTIVKQ